LYTFTAGNNRHGSFTVFRQYPNRTDTKPQQERYYFGTIVPFGATEKRGEQSEVCQRSAPTGTRRNFVEVIFFSFIQYCCAPLTDNAALPPSQSRKVRKCPEKVTKCAVCFGFGDLSCGFVGVYSRQLLLKNAGKCGRMKAQTSRTAASYHGGMYSDCGKKPAGVVGHA